MDTNAEINDLKKQLATLKQRFDELARFVSVGELESGKKVLHVTCNSLSLQNPDSPESSQGMLCASDDGPYLSLWDSKGKARLIISVKEDKGSVQLFQDELKLGAYIGIDNENRPSVGVFDHGKPRAALRSDDKGGIVTAVHDDGLVRIFMRSEPDCGELLAVNADMKVVVKLSSKGPEGEGFLTTNHSNGKAAVILGTVGDTGAVLLNDKAGKVKHTLPSTDDEE